MPNSSSQLANNGCCKGTCVKGNRSLPLGAVIFSNGISSVLTPANVLTLCHTSIGASASFDVTLNVKITMYR